MADADSKALMKAKTLLNEAMKAIDDAIAADGNEVDDDTSQETTAPETGNDDDDTPVSSLRMKLSKYK